MPRQTLEANLAILDAVLPAGETLNCAEIADICGCARQTISTISHNAFNKIKEEYPELEDFMYEY